MSLRFNFHLAVSLAVALTLAGAADGDDVAELVKKLDSSSFAERELATAKLIESGLPAVVPLQETLKQANLEVNLRAIHVLYELTLAGDQDCSDAAQLALEQTTETGAVSIRRRAEAALRQLADARQSIMVEALKKLGAKFNQSSPQTRAFFRDDSVEQVVIGPEWRGEDKDFRRLRWLGDIRRLTLSGPRVSDEWLRLAREMKHVDQLQISRAKVSDTGLEALRDFPQLQRLELMYCPVSDASLGTLTKIPTLTYIKAYGTKMTADAVEKAREQSPQLKIDFRRGGLLGIVGQASPLGCQVGLVQEASAAALAGIRVGDVVVKVGDVRISAPEGLTGEIGKFGAGEEVSLTLVRELDVFGKRCPRVNFKNWGLAGKAHDLGWEITEVTPDSVAANAGFRKGDVLVNIESNRIVNDETIAKTLDDLTTESFGVEYVRNVQFTTVKATLGEWE